MNIDYVITLYMVALVKFVFLVRGYQKLRETSYLTYDEFVEIFFDQEAWNDLKHS